ncbi:acyltransferase [Sphingomonas sp. BK235]|uniref:acyltransferase family protein n=1 Tax=Sphingomonas sp. BK235 TaxID=2512131 RepID=UPI00104C337B|nr:acyltransferase [Sphingomonas sp. BK235]TCP33060.1 peptidoglycan/LPS O-acetylase OafA/YrhL [Sphingomonas sp. BK235]
MQRIPILDGWRALSILLVLAGHLLPLGPHRWALNGAAAASGMALFFTLSGFLITQFLWHRPDVTPFLIRRLFRIVPLAWAAMLALALVTRAASVDLAANLAFVANLPPTHLLAGGDHLWSLCVEVQFYLGVALLVALGGRRALLLLPLLCLAVTATRVVQHAPISIFTWQRIDEILAGATLALVHAHAPRWTERLPALLPLLLLPLVVAAAHEASGALQYARPYLAAAAVGCSIYAAPAWMRRLFGSAPARYVAEVSYAVYVFHVMFAATWLGSGGTVIRYAKRPLLFAAVFAAAHLSTFRFERPMIERGKRLERWLVAQRARSQAVGRPPSSLR